MPVTQNDRYISYTTAGGEINFIYDFRIYTSSGIAVTRLRAGCESVLVEITDYTVAGVGNQNGGSIKLTIPALANDRYILYGVGETRAADYAQAGAFHSSSINLDINNSIQISQQLRRDVDRKIGLDIADSPAKLTLPLKQDRQNKYVYFNARGDLSVSDSSTGAPIDASYIVQRPSLAFTNGQALSHLSTGLVKNKTATGILSIATQGADYYAPGGIDVSIADGGTGASTAATARANLGLAIAKDVQAYNHQLTKLANYNSNGLMTQTAAGTFKSRSIAAGSGTQITNGDGVVGNPTVSVDINGLIPDPTPDIDADYTIVYDASAARLKKVLLKNLLGNTVKFANSMTNSIIQFAHGFVVGNVLKQTGSGYALAQADSAPNSEVVGIVTEIISRHIFILQISGYIDTLTGLTRGTTYFLSPIVAGTLTEIAPTTAGQITKPLLIASGPTSGYVLNMGGVAVSAANVVTAPGTLRDHPGVAKAWCNFMRDHPGVAKAWCNFNGSRIGANTPLAGYNVTSITKNSTGNYTINFTTNFLTENYIMVGILGDISASAPYAYCPYVRSQTVSSFKFVTVGSNVTYQDYTKIYMAAFGD